MLRCLARSCMRNGRNVLIHDVTKFSPVYTAMNSSIVRSSRILHQSSPWLHVSPIESQRRAVSGSVFLSSAQSKDVDLSASLTDPAESDQPGDDFGMLSADIASRRFFRKSSPELQNLQHQEEEEEEMVRPLKYRRRNTPTWYFLQCKKLIKENKLQEALDLFARDMLKGERLQPEECNYTILIGGCGRAGQLKKAFKLYNDMKKRGLVPTDATYTALFNACAETPWKEQGLQQALKLEQELRCKNYILSDITYHALLKTHALTNHLQACLHTLRDMLQAGHAITQETFHYLLMGCVKDKETGFRLTLQVWRQMLRSGIRPDSKNYNLLLRSARDCGIGDPIQASDLLLSSDWTGQSGRGRTVKARPGSRGKAPIDIDLLEKQLFIQPGHHGNSVCHQDNSLYSSSGDSVVVPPAEPDSTKDSSLLVLEKERPNVPMVSPSCQLEPSDVAPNLLDLFEGKRSAVVSIGTVNGASDRLALIGGAKGLLEKMAVNGLHPDLKTLTLLADTMEPSHQSLQILLQVAKQHKVKLDVAFFNSVIRRAARAGDLDGAKAVVRVMHQRNVSVDVQTYGSLALGCRQQKDGLQLLKDMEEAGLRTNVQVFGALIGQATRRLDYIYLKTILGSMRDMGVWPNEVIIRQLEFAAQYPPNYDQYKRRNNYMVHINGFRGYYQQWLRSMPAQDPEGGQAEMQPETDQAGQKKVPEHDGRTCAQKNQQAAVRRYNTHKKYKQGSTASPF